MPTITAEYSYTDTDGRELYQCVRTEPKGFYQRHRNGNGQGWVNKLPDEVRVLYHLKEVMGAIAYGEPVYLVEGEKDVHTLEGFNLTATTNVCGGGHWDIRYSESLAGADVVLILDNDDTGKRRGLSIPAELCSYAKSIKVVDLSKYWHGLFGEPMPDKADVTDFFEKGGTKADLLTICNMVEEYRPIPSSKNQETLLPISLADLRRMEIPEAVFVVKNLLVEDGITVLAGKTKLGKSWLALQIAQAVALGGMVLGEEACIGKVLYLGLEDSLRRLKSRAEKQGCPDTPNLFFLTAWPVLKAGGMNAFQKLVAGGGYKLVIIDTYNRFVKGSIDQNDAGMMTLICDGLQAAAKQSHAAILVVHHHRKAGDSSDWTDDVAGSYGITAAADTILCLYRKRGERGATLRMTGRDVEETETLLSFDVLTGCWQRDEVYPGVRRDSRQQKLVDILLAQGGRITVTEWAKALYGDNFLSYKGGISEEVSELLIRGVIYRAEKEGREQYFRLSSFFKEEQ